MHFATDHLEARMDWKFYQYACRVRGYYLLYHGLRELTVVPTRAFRDASQLQQFDDLLLRNMMGRVELRP